MNKLCYRVVFNKSRGLMMAVQEIARSRGKSNGAASTTSPALHPLALRLRGMAQALAAAFGATALMAGLAAAQIVADPHAPGRQQATVLNAANGVLQVNVQTPSAAGVSRNVYNRFDVPASGAILNNSRAAVQTQLGGWVDANPWMAQGTAKVILNEVNSNNPSQLRGYIEVAGVKAETVIANAAGIVVDGGGFINVSRATLTTGTPLLNADGALTGYTVQRGLISIDGAGLDARQTDYTALIARSVQLNAGLWAQQLEVLTGANQVTLATGEAGSANTLAPAAGEGEAPRYGIDTALLGGMYANKITLIGTEAGVGVRNAGKIGAAAGELIVTAEGRLENLGSLAASKALALTAQGGVGNSGSVYGEAAVSVRAGAAVDNSGTLYAAGQLDVSTPAALVNSGTLSGAAGLQLAAASLSNSKMLSSDGRASITVQGDIDNSHAVIQAQSVALASTEGALNNQSGKIVQSGAALLDITADQLSNINGGQIGAAPAATDTNGGGTASGGSGAGTGGGTGGTGSGGASTGTNTGTDSGGTVGTGGTNTPAPGGSGSGTGGGNGGAVAPTPVPDGYLRVATSIDNNAGQIMSGGAIGLNVHALDNAGGQLNLSSLNVNGDSFSNHAGQISVLRDFTLRTGVFDNSAGKLLVGGNFDGQSQAFNNAAGLLSTGQNLLLASADISNGAGKIVANGSNRISVTGAVDNHSGYIQAGSGLTLSATGKLDNRSGTLEANAAAIQIQAADIDNSAGRIASAGSGASTVHSDTNLLNTGAIGANGALDVQAQTMQNQGTATVQAGGALDLGISQQLDNAGAISSGGALNLVQTVASLNNAGQIVAGGHITIDVQHANNAAGQIGTSAGSGADIALSARDINNSSGKVIADHDISLNAKQTDLNNTSGVIHAGHDGSISAAQNLLNNAGLIETTGSDSKLTLTSGALSNLQGTILNTGAGDTQILAQSDVLSTGNIAGNGRLTLDAQRLTNRGTLSSGKDMLLELGQQLDNTDQISSAGKLNIDARAAAIHNQGQIAAVGDLNVSAFSVTNPGTIATIATTISATPQGQLTLSAAQLNNDGGNLIGSGGAEVRIAGDVSNRAGLIRGGDYLQFDAQGRLDNTSGYLESIGEASFVDLHAHSIDNSAGRITSVGSGGINVTADTSIYNSGAIGGNGMLLVNADTLLNAASGNVSSTGNLALSVSSLIQNDGAIQSGGTLTSGTTTQQLNNRGDILATTGMQLAAVQLDNSGGRIATASGAGAALTIRSHDVHNQHGTILSDGATEITASGTLDNQSGLLQSRGDQRLSVGGLLNNHSGVIETLGATAGMQVQAGAIDNTDGRIVNAGKGDVTISSASYIQNNSVIGANGNLALNALTVTNSAGGAMSSGANLTLGVRDALTNYGAISSAGQLTSTLATGTLTNAAQIIAGSHLQLAAGTLNNDGGQIATLKQSQGDVSVAADSVSNRSGLIQSDRNAIFTVTGAINNAQGLVQAGQNLQIKAGGALNNTNGAMEAVAADSTLSLHAGAVDNTAGRIVNVGKGDSHIGADTLLLNAGLVAGNGNVDVTAQTLQNTAAATVSAGAGLTLGVSQELSNQGAINSIGTLDFTQTTVAVHNSGNIISGGNATLRAGLFDNNGGQLATVKGSGSDIALTSQNMSNRGGTILSDRNVIFTVADAADNSGGAVQAQKNLQIGAGGALNNSSGVIEAVSADSSLQVQAGSIDNSAGRMVNVGLNATSVSAQTSLLNSGVIAGNGTLDLSAATARNLAAGSITSGQAMTLGVTQQLDNAGAVNSAGTLSFTQVTGTVNNSGQLVAAGTATITAGALHNDNGIIATLQNSGSAINITSDSISNHSGRVQADGDAVLKVGGALDNAQGVIQAGRDMQIGAAGLLSNNAGVIEAIAAASSLQVQAGAIDNGSGRIVNVGSAATSIQADTRISSSGTIAGNGVLALDAQSVQNSGTITAAGQTTIHADSLNNDGGQIATLSNSGADIVIDAQLMSNRSGRVLANGDAAITLGGALDNAQGTLQAGRDMQLDAGGTLGNVGGVIETLAAGSSMNVQGQSIDNTSGRIVNVGTGDTRVSAQATLLSSGMIAGNGDLFLSALTAQNRAGGALASGGNLELGVTRQMINAGTVSSAGMLNFSQTGASFSNSGQMISGREAVFRSASFNNDGGQIATASGSGASITVDSGSVSNRGGKLLANGDVSLTSDAAVDNSGGTLQASKDIALHAGGALNNNSGAIEAGGAASTLTIQAASVDSTAGRIVNVGSGDTTIQADSIINSGLLAGNGDVTLTAQTLTNNTGGSLAAGGNLELGITQQLNNHAAIASTGKLNFNQSAAALINDGQIVAGGTATVVAQSVVNDNGQIATAKGGGADLTLTTNSLSNVKGQILADGKGTLAIAGALNNQQGTIQSVGDLQLQATGALSNDAGAIEAAGAAAKLTLSALSIDNGTGRIANIGSGDLSITSQGAITNNGVIAGNGNLLLKATTLQSGANGNIATGKNMDLQVTQQLDNQGKINSGGTLTFNQSAATLRNSGTIVSAGNALITAKEVNNNGGQMGTGVGTDGDLALTTQSLSNDGGHITTGRDLTVVTHVLQGAGELQGGRDLALTMDGDYTQNSGTQQFHSNRDLSLTVTGNITNNATFEAVRNLSLSGNNVVNNAGAVIQGQGVALKAAGDLTNAGEINGEGQLILSSGGTVSNTNAIVGGDLTLVAQNLNNTGASTLLGATNSIALGVAGTVNNTGGATIYSAGSLSISAADGGATSVVNNISSTIEASGDLGMNAATLNNIRENVTLTKVETVDETQAMAPPSWYNHGNNHDSYETSAGNYYPHEVYYVNPADILETTTVVSPDGVTYGRAVIRTHANDSAFFWASTGLYNAYGARDRISVSEGTRVLYFQSSQANQANPDQGGPTGTPSGLYLEYVTKWTSAGPNYSSAYGSCSTDCVRFVTSPGFDDPVHITNRDVVRTREGGYDMEKSKLAHHVAIEDQIAPGSGALAQILSGGNMHLSVSQALTNQYGNIMATGALNIDGSAAITNEGATLYRTHTFDGTWTSDKGATTAYTMPTLTEVIGTAAGTISGGKGVSISGRSFANVDVNVGVAGNIRDSVNVLSTGNNTATGASHASGSGLNGGSTAGHVNGSGLGNNAGAAGNSGNGANVALNGQASGSGRLNTAADGALANGSGAGNHAQTSLDTSGSGIVNNSHSSVDGSGSSRSNNATLNAAAKDSGVRSGALGDIGTAGGASQTQGASQVGGNANAIKVAPNGLSTLNPNANGAYVFETRSQFANHGDWISSDYLLNALNMDPATTQKRLGDGFYEQRMVRDQLIELTGRAPTDGLSDDSRYKELLTSGVSFAEQYNLRPGIALSADQIAHLTSDIVWMESETVSLPDGTVEQVLVPKVYLAHAGDDAVKAGGALVTGAGVDIRVTESLANNGGLIDGGNGRTVLVAGQDIVNKGGTISGGEMVLQAKGDIINQSLTVKQEYASVNTSGSYTSLSNQASITASGALTISAGRDLADTGGTITAASANLTAGRDISFNALETGSTYASSIQGFTEKDSATNYKAGQISTSGDLSLTAKQDLTLSGTQISAGGSGALSAGRDVTITAVVNEVNTSVQNDPSSKMYDKQIHENQTVAGASINAGGQLAIKAGLSEAGSLNLSGSSVSAGTAAILAASKDVNITEVMENHLSDTASTRTSSSVFRSTTTNQADYSATSLSVGSSVSGGSISINSGNNLTVKGSAVAGDDAVVLTAKNDVSILAATSTDAEKHSTKTVESGFLSGGGFGISYGTRTTTTEQDKDATIQSGQSRSIVGSINGDLTIVAGNALTVSGSDVNAGHDMDLAGKSVTIDPGHDDSNGKFETKMTQDGLTLAIGGTVVSAIQAAQSMSQAAGQTSDSRVQALAAATAAMAAKNAAKDIAQNGANVSLSLTVGHSETEQTQTTASSYHSGSSLNAGNDISITATGGGDASNINIIGSDINAKHDVSLSADNQVNILAAQDTESQHSQSKSLSAAAGIAASIGTNGMAFGVTASVSAGRGSEDGDGVTQLNSHVNAGQQLTISSGGDTNIKGGVVSGNQVVAEIGGDLNIVSLQDTAKFDSKNQSISVSGTVGFGASVSGSVSQSQIHNDYASVQEQSGIAAGDGGFQLAVRGNTDLVGGVISSTAAGFEKNVLNTGSLTLTDISNHSVTDASSLGLSGGMASAGTGSKSGSGDVNLMNMGKDGAALSMPSAAALNDSSSSTTKSGISAGLIVITNPAAQQASTGQSVTEVVAGLNRDVTTGVDTSGKIGNDFDKNSVAATMSIVSAFGAAAANEVGNYAVGQLEKAAQLLQQAEEESDPDKQATLIAQASEINENWKEGGASRVALHAIVGGLTGGADGALGAAATAELVPELAQKIADLDVPDVVKQGLLLSAGIAVGDVAGGTAGAASGVTEVENNFLKHSQAAAMTKEFNDCEKKADGCGDAEYVAIRNKYLNLSRQNMATVDACIKSGDVTCVSNLESQAALPNEISRNLVYGDYTIFAKEQDKVLLYGSIKGNASLFGTDLQQAAEVKNFRDKYCVGISAKGCSDLVNQAINDRLIRAIEIGVIGAVTPVIAAQLRTLQLPTKTTLQVAPGKTNVTTPYRGVPDELLADADFAGQLAGRTDIVDHLINPGISGKQISGGHDFTSFKTALTNAGGVIVGTPVETGTGIYSVEYQLPNSKKPFTKTVYDPALYPEMPSMTVEAVNKALVQYQITGNVNQTVVVKGVKFTVPISLKPNLPPTVRTAYPSGVVLVK
jgi:filamentous hemagglutinin